MTMHAALESSTVYRSTKSITAPNSTYLRLMAVTPPSV
jgi:hypothetical protein